MVFSHSFQKWRTICASRSATARTKACFCRVAEISKKKLSVTSGLTLVEVLIAAAIILVAVMSLLGVHSFYLRSALENGAVVKAVHLAEEGIEAMRYLRDVSWSQNIAPLTNGVPYGLAFNTAWATDSTSMVVGKFYRTVTFSSVERDAQSDIVSSGGVVDPNTKLVTVSVSWLTQGATTTKTVMTYLTNIHEDSLR